VPAVESVRLELAFGFSRWSEFRNRLRLKEATDSKSLVTVRLYVKNMHQ
jgi:hypothetical protein